jgi:hypothetical protein
VALFTASVLVLFSFIYWSSVRYMADQSDAAIRSEINTLSERYENRGLSGLRHLISDRIDRQQPTGTSIYLLTDPLGRVIVGNINRWPKTPVQDGWLNFNLETRDLDKPRLHPARTRQGVFDYWSGKISRSSMPRAYGSLRHWAGVWP